MTITAHMNMNDRIKIKMNKRSGISMSIWIWVIIGIVIAAFVFAVAQQNIILLLIQLNNQNAVSQYNQIYSMVSEICTMAKGSRDTTEISINREVYALYTSMDNTAPTDSAPYYIENLNKTSGYYLCYQFNVEHEIDKFTCKKTSCNITMTYMGTPRKGSKLDKIAQLSGDAFHYEINIAKTGKDSVLVDAMPVLK